MDEGLHSIASLNRPSLGWAYHDLGVINADMSHLLDSKTPPLSHPFDSDLSTGYLQDALFKFSSKRRRLLWLDDDNNDDHKNGEITHELRNCLNWGHADNSYENFGYLLEKSNTDSISGESMSKSVGRINEDGITLSGLETPDETISTSETLDSLTSFQKTSLSISDNNETLYSTEPISPSGGKRKKRTLTKVVYPFALVKPGGTEGDLTLNDINERILMPPTRPVRHPVGDFACRPLVSPDGLGLSGKAVVALTRIQTQGRGTITIVRTKG